MGQIITRHNAVCKKLFSSVKMGLHDHTAPSGIGDPGTSFRRRYPFK